MTFTDGIGWKSAKKIYYYQLLKERIVKLGSVIFVSGVYGVGKSTLCNKLSKKCNINYYSAGDVISDVNGEKYGSNKIVKDKELNQNILVERISEKLEREKIIILAGHFCILGNDGKVEQLPLDTYSKLQLSAIILLESEPDIIIQNLRKRDDKNYSIRQIEEFLHNERDCAKYIAESLSIPLFIRKMDFSCRDLELICLFLKETYSENLIGY